MRFCIRKNLLLQYYTAILPVLYVDDEMGESKILHIERVIDIVQQMFCKIDDLYRPFVIYLIPTYCSNFMYKSFILRECIAL